MGFLDKMKNLVGLEEEEYEEEEVVATPEKKPADITKIVPASDRYDRNLTPMKPSEQPASTGAATGVSTNTSTKFTSQWKMSISIPADFNDSPKLVDDLKAKKPVVINLESLETDVARKIFDFLSGATYALNGNVQKIANNIFLFTPANVNVDFGQPTSRATTENPYKSAWK